MNPYGEVEETPIPPEFREEFTKASNENLDNEEAIQVIGVSLVQSLYLSMSAYRGLQKSRGTVYNVQNRIAATLGLNPDDIQSFDTERGVVIHRKKAKAN